MYATFIVTSWLNDCEDMKLVVPTHRSIYILYIYIYYIYIYMYIYEGLISVCRMILSTVFLKRMSFIVVYQEWQEKNSEKLL